MKLQSLAATLGLVLLHTGVTRAYPSFPRVTSTELPDMPKGSGSNGVIHRDGGASFRRGSEIAFTFGDTFLSSGYRVNTMFHSTDLNPDNGITSGYNFRLSSAPPEQFVPWSSEDIAYNQ